MLPDDSAPWVYKPYAWGGATPYWEEGGSLRSDVRKLIGRIKRVEDRLDERDKQSCGQRRPPNIEFLHETFTSIEIVNRTGDTVAVFTANGARWVADEEDQTLRVFVEARREDIEETNHD